MVWQKVKSHVSDNRVMVQSRNGKEYPVDTIKRFADSVYSHEMQDKNEEKELWAWVEFSEHEAPRIEDISSGSPYGGPPRKPPWEY